MIINEFIFLDSNFLKIFNFPNKEYNYNTLKLELKNMYNTEDFIDLNENQFKLLKKKCYFTTVKKNKKYNIRLNLLTLFIIRFFTKDFLELYDSNHIFNPVNFKLEIS